MARNLELRSTYLYTDSGLGAMSLGASDSSLLDKPSTTLKKSSFEDHTCLHKKNEYSVATLMSKTLRDSLDVDMREIVEPHMAKKLTSIIRQGYSTDGDLMVAESKAGLENLNLNSSNDFSKGGGTKYFIRRGAHKGHIILHVPAFIPVRALNVPEGATNFKLSAKLVALSNYRRDKDLGVFVPSAPEAHGKCGTYESSMLPLLKIPTQPITAQISTDRGRPLSEQTGTVLVLAAKFYKYNAGKFTHLPQEGIIQILKVF